MESTIAFSTAFTIDLSQTCTESSRGSGTLTVASWLSGMWRAIGSTCTGSSIEAEARPVRKPPSSCLSDWVAPCMRRFNSLMSKLPVGMTLSLS